MFYISARETAWSTTLTLERRRGLEEKEELISFQRKKIFRHQVERNSLKYKRVKEFSHEVTVEMLKEFQKSGFAKST